ncbi:siderophore-interacting protein (plasmid) [Coraliomargarita sp. W4R53]
MTSPTFILEPREFELRFRKATLVHREWITDAYVRLRIQGDELRGFDSLGADDHVRVFFPDGEPDTVEQLRAAPSREYTPLVWGDDWLELEFAVHGDTGIAARWAATAPLGSPAGVGGPRGSKALTGRPDAWFLAGDETAVPAIRRFAALMDADALGRIIVEVQGIAHELHIDTPSGVIVEQLHRGAASPGSALATRLSAFNPTDRPEGSVLGFVAAEQAIVKPARALLLERWALAAESVIIKGYWKSGNTEYHAPH